MSCCKNDRKYTQISPNTQSWHTCGFGDKSAWKLNLPNVFFLSFCNTFLVFVIFWLYFTHFVILWQYFVGFCYLSTIFQWFLSYFGKLSNPQKILTWSAPPPPWTIPVFSLRNSQQQTFTFKSLTLNMINLSILLLNNIILYNTIISFRITYIMDGKEKKTWN